MVTPSRAAPVAFLYSRTAFDTFWAKWRASIDLGQDSDEEEPEARPAASFSKVAQNCNKFHLQYWFVILVLDDFALACIACISRKDAA